MNALTDDEKLRGKTRDLHHAALPLIRFLQDYHPHHTVLVTSDRVELVEGSITIRFTPVSYDAAVEWFKQIDPSFEPRSIWPVVNLRDLVAKAERYGFNQPNVEKLNGIVDLFIDRYLFTAKGKLIAKTLDNALTVEVVADEPFITTAVAALIDPIQDALTRLRKWDMRFQMIDATFIERRLRLALTKSI